MANRMDDIKYLVTVVFIQIISVSFNIVTLYFGRYIMDNDEFIFNVITKYIIFSAIVLYFICLPIIISNRYIVYIEKHNDMKN